MKKIYYLVELDNIRIQEYPLKICKNIRQYSWLIYEFN